jgi:MYXO-CTERM domain-containing protein
MRSGLVLLALGVAAVSTFAGARQARACGGCFQPNQSQSGDVITDERMIFRITPQATTLYDEISYSGNPQSFAWVLPIHGTVTVGLSSDILFAAIDAATVPTIVSPNPPQCASCSCGAANGGADLSGSGSGSSSGGGTPPVTVLSQQTVGPYATVQLQSSDPNALNAWLTANGYVIPADIQPVVDAYVQEGFDFLALKLAPGQGVSAMRPVRVTTQGAGLTLPLRMVAAGTGATVGVTFFIVGDGRYEPQNMQTFTISASQLVWDWSTQESNYTTVRAQKEASFNNAAWQIESALQLSPYQIESPVLSDEASQDYLPIPASDSDAGDDAGAGETADQVRQDDLAVLFPGGDQSEVFVTRFRSDLSRAALANDLVLQATADQSQLSNIYNVTQSVNAPTCPAVPNPCPPCGSDFGGSSGGSGGSVFGNSGGSGNGSGSSGCSTSPDDRSGANGGVILAGLVAAALLFSRARRRAS